MNFFFYTVYAQIGGVIVADPLLSFKDYPQPLLIQLYPHHI